MGFANKLFSSTLPLKSKSAKYDVASSRIKVWRGGQTQELSVKQESREKNRAE